jgi:hypothetical protein
MRKSRFICVVFWLTMLIWYSEMYSEYKDQRRIFIAVKCIRAIHMT